MPNLRRQSQYMNKDQLRQPLHNNSISKGYNDHLPILFHPELDDVPVSVIELPTNKSGNYHPTDFEYGRKRFTTLPGEPFPLDER